MISIIININIKKLDFKSTENNKYIKNKIIKKIIYRRLIKGPYSNLTNFTTQIKVNSKYSIKNNNDNKFIDSYSLIDIKFEKLILKKKFLKKII